MIFEYKGKKPKIGKNVFIAPTAVIVGDVEIGDHASIWYGVVIRGDLAPVTIGENSNIQDNCTVHTDTAHPAVIAENVTVGHNAVVHGCTVEADCLIGIGAVVLNGACIKAGSVVASGSVVKEGQIVGPRHLVAGVPAMLRKELTEDDVRKFGGPLRTYLELAKEYMKRSTYL